MADVLREISLMFLIEAEPAIDDTTGLDSAVTESVCSTSARPTELDTGVRSTSQSPEETQLQLDTSACLASTSDEATRLAIDTSACSGSTSTRLSASPTDEGMEIDTGECI